MRFFYLSLLTAFVSGQTLPEVPEIDSSLIDNDESLGGVSIKYSSKYTKKWPHCANIKCIHNVINSVMMNACNTYNDCTGFSFSHGVGGGVGWGCLKKCGAKEFGGYGSGTHDYFVKTAVPAGSTCTYDFFPYMDSNLGDLGHYSAPSVEVFKVMCSAVDKCVCFNSNGWLKHTLKPKSEWNKWTTDKTKGLYVKKCSVPPPPAPPAPKYKLDNYSCEGANQKKNLGGGFKSPAYCLAAAEKDPACAPTIMFSDSYNKAWGCRCCAKDAVLTPHTLWDTYSSKPVNAPYKMAGVSCEGASQSKNLGTGLSSPEMCLTAAVRDPKCAPMIMFSNSYNTSWGCRCCAKDAILTPNTNWDTYGTSKFSTTPYDLANYSCEGANQKKNLGTKFATPEQCLIAATKDKACAPTIMFSKSYNTSWGCRCCSPGGKVTPHNLWHTYSLKPIVKQAEGEEQDAETVPTVEETGSEDISEE